MRIFLGGFLIGFIMALTLFDDLGERKLNNFLKEQKDEYPTIKEVENDKEQKS